MNKRLKSGIGKEANMGQLIKWLDGYGWDKGLAYLEKENLRLQELQAYYFGDPETQHEARLLGSKIAKQGITLIRLKDMQKQREGED